MNGISEKITKIRHGGPQTTTVCMVSPSIITDIGDAPFFLLEMTGKLLLMHTVLQPVLLKTLQVCIQQLSLSQYQQGQKKYHFLATQALN